MNERPSLAKVRKTIGPAIEKQFETICRTLISGPAVAAEADFLRVVTGEMHPLGNFAVISDPASLTQTRRAMEPLSSGSAPSAVIFPGAPSAEVQALVTDRGYVLAESMPAMALDLGAMKASEPPAGYTVREIDPIAERDSWNDAFAAGYEVPRAVARLFGPGRPRGAGTVGAIRYFAATASAVRTARRFVATSVLFLEGGLAGIYCVSTIPGERGRGLGTCMTTEPLRIARGLGYRIGILQSTAMGEPVYRRLGFEQLGCVPLYVRIPPPA